MAAKKQERNFMMQGAILAAASIVVRLIGIIYRVPLNNILGEKGVAYYGVAFDVYSIMLLLSSYSLPLAVSKMVSGRTALGEYKNTRRIFISAICFGACLGIVAFCISFFGADLFAKILNYPQSAVALRVLSPALVILSILGVMRGYFQGLGTMVPTALSNIFEQIVNAIVSIVAATALYRSASNMDVSRFTFKNVAEAYGAAGGTLGTVCGALAALLFMVAVYLIYRRTFIKQVAADVHREKEPLKNILKVLVVTIIPVILSTTIYNISGLLDSGIFSNIMEFRGLDHDDIDILTGMFTGNYRLIVNVPIAIASALSSSLIPSVVRSMTVGNRGEVLHKIDSAIRVMMIVAMPCTVGIGVLALPIMNLLFPSSTDPERVALMLMIGCISVVLYSLSTITNSILQGIDKMNLPVKHSAIALVSHLALLAVLLFITPLNIFAVVIADIFFTLLVCILNAVSLKKILGYHQEIRRTFILPLACAVGMGICTYFINWGCNALTHSNAVAVVVSILLAVVIYAILLLVLKVIDEEELSMLPGGTKMVRICRKLKLMR